MKKKTIINSPDCNIPFSYNQYLLNQIDNYKEILNKDLNYILTKYIELIIEYIKFITEKINIKQYNYYRFIFIRGYDTITSVFKIMLYYTKNVDLTYYHSQKAFYFYVEFIEQISTDQNSFLQLSSREASLFVYKKTIFDINLEKKKNINECSSDEKNIFTKLDNYISIYKNIILCCLKHLNLIETNNVNNICNNFKKYSQNKDLLGISVLQFTCINLLLDKLMDFNINIDLLFEIIELFIKKINNKKNIYESIKGKLLDNNIINYIDNSQMLIDWIFL